MVMHGLANVKKKNNTCFYLYSTCSAFSALRRPYSQVCKDDLMMVNWPKHVKVKIKIHYFVSLQTETICFLLVIIIIIIIMYLS